MKKFFVLSILTAVLSTLFMGCATVYITNDTPFEINAVIQTESRDGFWTTQDQVDLDPYESYSDHDSNYNKNIRIMLFDGDAKYRGAADSSVIVESIQRSGARQLYVLPVSSNRFIIKEGKPNKSTATRTKQGIVQESPPLLVMRQNHRYFW
jgi:hypothetical protein